MDAMKMLWQTQADHLVCRWSEVGGRVRYDSQWIQDASRDVPRKNAPPLFLDFRRLSPFAGRKWWDPDARVIR